MTRHRPIQSKYADLAQDDIFWGMCKLLLGLVLVLFLISHLFANSAAGGDAVFKITEKMTDDHKLGEASNEHESSIHMPNKKNQPLREGQEQPNSDSDNSGLKVDHMLRSNDPPTAPPAVENIVYKSLPADFQESLKERETARIKLRSKGGFRMGEPQMTYDRIDSEHARKMGVSKSAYQLRRYLLVQREKHSLERSSDENVVQVLEGLLKSIPSEDELNMMVDPGDWGDIQRRKRMYVETLLADPALRQRYMRDGEDEGLYSILDGRAMKAVPSRGVPNQH